ncbi:Nn.00g110090.m01.CDS01 [Neocucurbitaria sp. VM-36]
MYGRCSIWSFLLVLCSAVALTSPEPPQKETFSCTGGSIYFIAHPADGLLFQNPDLFHDLYVFKCVTTVVFTSGDRGIKGNVSLSLEHGLKKAYSWIAGLPMNEPFWRNTLVRIAGYEIQSWCMKDMPNIQILYLRIPDGPATGQGYAVSDGESLAKLYNSEIASITTTDGNATYTLGELKHLIDTILYQRQANDIGVLDHKASISNVDDILSDHADHVTSARIIMDVINNRKIDASVKTYAGDFMRKLEANLHVSHPDFRRKATAFFKYAKYDEEMCQSLEECEKCENAIKDDEASLFPNHDVKYVARYLEREYYVL